LKCPECGGSGKVHVVLNKHLDDDGLTQMESGMVTCKACNGTGNLEGFKKKAYSSKLTALRESVKSLKTSRTDLIARVTELQGQLNAYKNDVQAAVDLAEFYETQSLENEKLADLLKIFIGTMIEAGIDVPDAGKAADTMHNALRLLKAARTCVQSLHALKGEQPEQMLLEAIDQLFSLEKPKVEMTDLKDEPGKERVIQTVSLDEDSPIDPEKCKPQDETAILEKEGEADAE